MADAILDVISEKPPPKPKAKAKAKASTKKAAAKPTVQPEEPPSKKSKATFPFPGEGLSQFDIAMWPFTCAQSRLPTE